MPDFESERRKWNDEVDREAARLVRNGTPPLKAIEQASRNVSERRRRAAGAGINLAAWLEQS